MSTTTILRASAAKRDPQPYLDRATELTARQQALLALCDEHGLQIYGDSTCASEDIAAFFPLIIPARGREDQTEKRLPAEQQPERYCAVTLHDDIVYLTPLYRRVADAKARAVEFIDDSIHSEFPVEVVDLDTGRRWRPQLSVTWPRSTT